MEFRPERDERLKAVMARAGMYAWFVSFGMFFILGALSQTLDDELLRDANFMLVLPWFASTMVFLGMLLHGKYYSSIREENARASGGSARGLGRLLLSTLLFATIMFTLKHFDILDRSTENWQSDALDSAGTAVLWGVVMYFILLRTPRQKDDER
ncbi:MAG TPA: hypothetical protein PK916_01315 [Bacteroidota bacterium]|nr:hypothetical protein [Bacteroidota bacterium]